jgi:trk system potassium uptake protein TrkH
MNHRMICRLIGYVLLTGAALMLLPLLVSFYYQDGCAADFGITIAVTAAVGAMLVFFVRPKTKVVYAKESFAIVSFSWILLSLFGAIPFTLSGAIPSYIDSIFETVSGFTTTGASILSDVESLPRSILFWRSFTHWIGGMGVLVFIAAILPLAGERSMTVLRAEIPGPSVGKLVSKTSLTAKLLYAMYIVLTLLQILFLIAGDMPFFDSVVTAFGTAGTGGFAIKNASMAAYGSAYLEWVVAIFMLLFGVNFSIYFLLLLRDFKQVGKNSELWCYLGIFLVSTSIITVEILPITSGFSEALRQAAFQVSSVMTTTGFATADFNLWPSLSKFILFLLMLCGASAGSTCGGIKVSRVIIIFRKLRAEFVKLRHPRSVRKIQFCGKPLEDETVDSVLLFTVCYFLVILAVTLCISIDGFDLETNISASVACVSNIGPGFGMVGATGNYGAFSGFSKLVLSLGMLLGRLEIFPLLVALTPGQYHKKS